MNQDYVLNTDKNTVLEKKSTNPKIFVTEAISTNRFSMASYLVENQSLENSIIHKSKNLNAVKIKY